MIHDEDDNHKYSISYSVNITMSCLIHKYRWVTPKVHPPNFYANGIESSTLESQCFLGYLLAFTRNFGLSLFDILSFTPNQQQNAKIGFLHLLPIHHAKG